MYVRPKRDQAGNFLVDASGQQQFESAEMLQNSGISIVIPAMYVLDLLKELQKGETPVSR